MGIASKMLKKSTRKAQTWFMDRVGSKLVSGMADTSADAPSAFTQPKRDLYSKMKSQAEGAEDASENPDADSAGT